VSARYAARPLQAGQEIRLSEDGPVRTVERVTPCAAYVRSGAPRHVVLHDDEGNVVAEFDSDGSRVVAISRNAFVFEGRS